MQRRRARPGRPPPLSWLRWRLFCAYVAATTLLLLPGCPISPGKGASDDAFPALPKMREMTGGGGGGVLRWLREPASLRLSKWRSCGVTERPRPPAAAVLDGKLWRPGRTRGYAPCIGPTENYTRPTESSRGYLLVHANGGLNQMRAGISDMVAIARIINATLIIPELDKKSFWQDNSTFLDVFDEEHFISSLSADVRVEKKLPRELARSAKAVRSFKSWSGVDYYMQKVFPLWEDHQVIRAAKSDSRLANNDLPIDIQKLRCRAFFSALRFAPPIEAFGKKLVERMKALGPYVALHLRYEKDMLAFSGCSYGLSPTESNELAEIRQNTTHWKIKEIDPLEQRAKGYCPLTPDEVGMFLAALGFQSRTPIYVAAGEIYGGNARMVDLESRFPVLMNKEKLATPEELRPFRRYASQMAALDYIVSVESDVFVPSYAGNMARAVAGHRRFLGHRKTITPDRKSIVRLFDKVNQGAMREGKDLSSMIWDLHRRRQGAPRNRKGPDLRKKGNYRFRSEESFYENPLPECFCRSAGDDIQMLLSN